MRREVASALAPRRCCESMGEKNARGEEGTEATSASAVVNGALHKLLNKTAPSPAGVYSEELKDHVNHELLIWRRSSIASFTRRTFACFESHSDVEPDNVDLRACSHHSRPSLRGLIP